MSLVALFTFMYGQGKAHNFWHNRDIYFPISFSQENCAFQNIKNLTILPSGVNGGIKWKCIGISIILWQYLRSLYNLLILVTTMWRCGQCISYICYSVFKKEKANTYRLVWYKSTLRYLKRRIFTVMLIKNFSK